MTYELMSQIDKDDNGIQAKENPAMATSPNAVLV
jgi:hypothetical protein